MNHKRGRPKNRRAGCLMCKPHKMNGAKKGDDWTTRRQRRADASYREQVGHHRHRA